MQATMGSNDHQRLRDMKVSDLTAEKRRLVEVPYTATLANTLSTLVANRVVAVPVAAPPGHWIGAGGSMILESDKQTGVVRKHYIGMVTMLDVLAHIAGGGGDDIDKKMAVPVSSIIGHCLESLSLWTLNPNTSIIDCMEVFSKGIHRALVPADSQMANVSGVELVESASSYRMLTQMDVLRFIVKEHSSYLDGILSPVGEMGGVTDDVFAVTSCATVMNVIKCMRAASLHAVPIVATADGDIGEDHTQLVYGNGRKLVGTFSATDLRACPLSHLQEWLYLTVMDFTERVSANPLNESPDLLLSPRELITCYAETSLLEVIGKAVDNHVHRVWVVDHSGSLSGIVSLTDMIRVARVSILTEASLSGLSNRVPSRSFDSKAITSWAFAYVVVNITQAIIRDQRSTHPVSVLAKGFHGINGDDVYLSLLAQLGRDKVTGVTNLSLNDEEAQLLLKHDRAKAVEILVKDLRVFSTFNEELFKEITQLLTLDNFRENEQLSKYGDTKSARAIMLVELKKLIEANPLFRDKLQFPGLKNSRLRTLINQSLNWQHQLCKNPRPNPDIKTLFIDHSCGQTNGANAPSPVNNQMLGPLQKVGGIPPLGAHGPFQTMQAPVPTPLAGWMSNPASVPYPAHPAISGGGLGLGTSSMPASLKHPMPTPINALDYPSGDSEHVAKTARPMSISDEVNLPVNVLPVPFQGHGPGPAFNAPDDLPTTVARNLNQGSSPMSMDFHPDQQALLLVGTNVGDIGLWNVCSRERLISRNFKVWDLSACSMALQTALAKDPGVSVNRVIWSPDGLLFGVAYSRHIVQIYSYRSGNELRQHLEIDAHVGGVNDLAFSHPNKQLCVITCGDDKTIKVWDAASGAKQYTFEGHEAPVYSVCPHYKESIQFIFSTALDGKIKAWLYDNVGSRVDYDAPGRWCTTMSYSADGTRLFSCGTSKEGESYIVEWNESEGAVKRTYQGFRKRSLDVVQFDTIKNRFLAAGDDFSIKFWDMDNIQLLTAIDADGGLPASPRIRINKDGTLLAVSANDYGIKILANSDGMRMLRTFDLQYEASRNSETNTKPIINAISSGPTPTAPPALTSSNAVADRASSVAAIAGMNGDVRTMGDVKPKITEESNDKSKIWKLTEISEPSQCRSLRLPEHLRVTKISRLIYTNSGNALLSLASNAIHLLWKWQRSDRNSNGKATATVQPQIWQPTSGILMTNDLTDSSPEEAVSCFALSKNDSYVMSASGGKISLFNMMTFKTMTTFMPPPPAATFLAFHPQDNNIIAIGMDDSTIQIYNVRVDEVKSKLKGHSKRVTGLAFSPVLNILVSSGADAQLCVWSSDGWENQKSRSLQLPTGRAPTAQSDTRVQFHQDQVHFLVVHETQLAIYEATKLECVKQWLPRESAAPIAHATFSCDSQLVYASFLDATVCVFNSSNLRLRCRISPSSYLPANVSNSSVHPVVIAAHPQDANQFALGLSDGGVHVFEPLESEGKWGVPPPSENGQANTNPVTAASVGPSSGSDQHQR